MSFLTPNVGLLIILQLTVAFQSVVDRSFEYFYRRANALAFERVGTADRASARRCT